MSAPARRRTRAGNGSFVLSRARVIDLVALSVLFLLALLGFQRVYGTPFYLISGGVALAIALAVAIVGAEYRWGIGRTVLLLLGIHLLLGSAFATPSRAIAGVIPTLGSLTDLILASWQSWKANLTVAPPVGTGDGVLAVVWILMLVLASVSFNAVLRTRLYIAAVLGPVLLFIAAVVFTTSLPFLGVLRGVLFAGLALAWLTWRYESVRVASATSTILSDSVSPGSWKNPVLRRRVIGGGIIIALALGISAFVSPLLGPSAGEQRYALRETITPPFDPRRYVAPLSEFRGYHKNRKETELFTISGVDGGQLIRLATMDQYDLHVYNVAGGTNADSPSGAFLKTASGVDLHESEADTRTSTVTIGEYRGVWLPFPGAQLHRIEMRGPRAEESAAGLYINDASQTAVDATQLRSGDSYEVDYEMYLPPTEEQIRTMRFAQLELPDNAPVDQQFLAWAEEQVGNPRTDYERIENLVGAVKREGSFSHGVEESEAASLSGHNSARLLAMLQDIGFDAEELDAAPEGMIGDEEQYAALVAVMARELGYPARVVMGFKVPESVTGTATITGQDTTAWVEVAFDDVGWVRFDVVPDDDDTPTQPEPQEVEKPRPQVAQPPPPPAEPPSPPPATVSQDDPEEEELPTKLPAILLWILIILSPFALIALILAGIVAAKAIRRKRRRESENIFARLRGGWSEILDLRADMRAPVPATLTRLEAAAHIDQGTPASGVAEIARIIDRGTFAPEPLTETEVQQLWDLVAQSCAGMLAPLSRWERFRAAVSLRSFGRDTRSAAREAARQRKAEKTWQRRQQPDRLPWKVRLKNVSQQIRRRRASKTAKDPS